MARKTPATSRRGVGGLYLRDLTVNITGVVHHSVPTYQVPTMRAIPSIRPVIFTAGGSELSPNMSFQIIRRNRIE